MLDNPTREQSDTDGPSLKYQDLIVMLAGAPRADRALDLRIHIALFDPDVMVDGGGYRGERPVKHQKASTIWNDNWPHWNNPTDVEGIALHVGAPHYTSSFDDALKLVPEGLYWHAGHGKTRDDEPLGAAVIIEPISLKNLSEAEAPTAVLALCTAALKILSSQGAPHVQA